VTGLVNYRGPAVPALLFDLDGTLIDSVYQNVIAWREALATVDFDLSVWRIHRRIGMSGGLFISALLRETGRSRGLRHVDPPGGGSDLRQISQLAAPPGRTQSKLTGRRGLSARPGASRGISSATWMAAGFRPGWF
jgi:beta-phosphoglucomutase-like phosphatase (HAD superfamily)